MSVRATISDSKSDFHREFPYVIPPIYRKLADELLVELHLLSHQTNFQNNPIFATGLKEIFNTFTNGYKPNEHIANLFNAICNCNGFNPEEINNMSDETTKKINSMTKENISEYIFSLKEELKDKDYYSRINAIGIYKIIKELPDLKDKDNKKLDSEILKITNTLGYPSQRVEKDINLYRSNIDKMNQALEIIKQNLNSKK